MGMHVIREALCAKERIAMTVEFVADVGDFLCFVDDAEDRFGVDGIFKHFVWFKVDLNWY